MKTKNTKYDRLDHEKIIEIYKKNGSVVETSRLAGTTETLVKKVLVSYGIYVAKKNLLNDIDHEALIKRYEEIHLAEPVAKEFNISKSSVLKILHQNNIRVSKLKYSDQEIIDYYNKVKTIAKTALDLNIGEGKVGKVLHENNVELKTLKRVEPGDKFGMLTVIEMVGYHTSSGNNKHRLFKCLCECGNYTNFRTNDLTSKTDPKNDCGCIFKKKQEIFKIKKEEKEQRTKQIKEERERKRLLRELNKKPRTLPKYVPGYKHHRLTILSIEKKDKKRIATVECECGTIKQINTVTFTNTKSCGCLQIERSMKHGQCSRTDLNRRKWYDRWKGMVSRCHNPKNRRYKDYGARGVRVCDRWLEPNGIGSENYYNDIHKILGPQPSPEHTLDRIDNNGMYIITNMRWATITEQNQNQRRAYKK